MRTNGEAFFCLLVAKQTRMLRAIATLQKWNARNVTDGDEGYSQIDNFFLLSPMPLNKMPLYFISYFITRKFNMRARRYNWKISLWDADSYWIDWRECSSVPRNVIRTTSDRINYDLLSLLCCVSRNILWIVFVSATSRQRWPENCTKTSFLRCISFQV